MVSFCPFADSLTRFKCLMSLYAASSFPKLWPFLAFYIIWVFYIDKAPERGGRTSQWFRSARFWTYFAEYYPAS